MRSGRKPPKQRRSLRQSLRDLLRLIPGRTDKAPTIGSGILRRAEPSISNLPRFSTVSLFPDFESSHLNIEPRPSPRHTKAHTTTTPSPKVQPQTQRPLLPATSLSQFGLRDTYVHQGPSSRQIVYNSADHAHLSGASRQASIATLTASSIRRSASTLRLGTSSTTSLTSLPTISSQDTIQTAYPRSDASEKHYQQYQADGHPPHPNTKSSTVSTQGLFTSRDPVTLVEHFKSFCVLDTGMQGCPVTATSTELRYIFDIGEEFFLNNQECQGASMDIVTGSDAAGNQVTHLVMFSPLVSPSSGRSRFMLASLVDVTEFISEAASLPHLDPIDEEDSIVDDAPTPIMASPRIWDVPSYELSAEDLLGGCYVSETAVGRLERKPSDDIWLALAATEGKTSTSLREGRQMPRIPQLSPNAASTSLDNPVDEILEQFVSSLQQIYSDFFLLGKSPLDDNVYEMCNISPKVFASKEYVEGHLSKTARENLSDLSARLSGDCAFSMPVKWGTRGEPKQLYCSPLYGQSSLTWICFLVDGRTPILW